MKILLGAGANQDLKNKAGKTALDLAQEKGYSRSVELLKQNLTGAIIPEPENPPLARSRGSFLGSSFVFGLICILNYVLLCARNPIFPVKN